MILLVGFSEDEVRRVEDEVGEEVFTLGEDALEAELSRVVVSPRRYSGTCKMGERYVLMHEVQPERLREILNAVYRVVGGKVIPATTTPTSLNWKLRDLLEELKKEDEYFRSLRNPPSTS